MTQDEFSINFSDDEKLKISKKSLDFDEIQVVDELNIPRALIQIHALESEIQRRIRGFIELKREEIDRKNLRDFIETTEDSCARVASSVYKFHKSSRGHLMVNTVKDQEVTLDSACTKKLPNHESFLSGIEERLESAESFLQQDDGTTTKDVFLRLKLIEDKITQLKSVSPEYFQFLKRTRPTKKKTFYTLNDLDRIIAMKKAKKS